jgi:hypothetical protein
VLCLWVQEGRILGVWVIWVCGLYVWVQELKYIVLGRELFFVEDGREYWAWSFRLEEGEGMGTRVRGRKKARLWKELIQVQLWLREGAKEDKGKGVVKEASSSHPRAFTRAKNEAWDSQIRFLENCSEKAQWEVDQVEDMVKLKCKQTLNEKIWEEVRDRLHDPVYSPTKETKFFKEMELYWHVKATVAQTLEKCMADQKNILLTIEVFHGKFKLMCHSTYGTKFKILKASSKPNPSKSPTEGLASVGTWNCPITIENNSRPTQNLVADEEEEVQMDGE